jgi:hypothetical protein
MCNRGSLPPPLPLLIHPPHLLSPLPLLQCSLLTPQRGVREGNNAEPEVDGWKGKDVKEEEKETENKEEEKERGKKEGEKEEKDL